LTHFNDLAGAENPIVFFSNGYGDHILTLPAMRALSHFYPNRLHVICGKGIHQTFFAGINFLSATEIVFGHDGKYKLFDWEEVAKHLGECDLFISLNPWHSPAMDNLLQSLNTTTIGFFDAYKIHLKRSPSTHAVDLAFSIPKFLGPDLKLVDFVSPPQLNSESVSFARDFKHNIAYQKRILVVHAETLSNKMWHKPHFVKVLNLFLNNHPDFIVCVVGLSDLQICSEPFLGRCFNLLRHPLHHSFALIEQADLFIGIDSSMLHAADFFGIPGVGLFGPTKADEFGFRFALHRHIQGVSTLDQIAPETVYEALESLWAVVSSNL